MLIFIVGNVLNNLGQIDWFVPAIMLIVGLHFLPLARLLRYRFHYVTGGALIAVALVYPWLAPGGPTDPLGGLLAAAILWVGAGRSLWAAGRGQRHVLPAVGSD